MKVNDEIGISVEFGIDLLNRLMTSAFKGIQDWEKKHDPLGTATSRYVGGLIKRYNVVNVLGMGRPILLENLYVRANILKKITARMGMSAEELEKYFDRDNRTFGERVKPVDGEEIVNQLQKFIVLGKPGAGKTTYLKYLTLMMFNKYSQIENRRLPIFVTLREWADDKNTLIDFISGQFSICGFEEAEPFIEQMLKNGDCVVLFDGLDEVSQEADQMGIIRKIKDFTDKYRDNQFIISCRVAAYNHWFEQFTDVEMADFNEEQKETFIRNWFHGESIMAIKCWEKLKNNSQLREMAAIPLLLALLCITYQELKDFPPNRSALYQEAIDALLVKWDSSKNINRGEVYQKLTLFRKKEMFAQIAAETFEKNQYFIPERVLTKHITKFIENLPGAKDEQLEPDSLAILKSIEAQHGIFAERARYIYSFSHLTFQEYFTAINIVDNTQKGALENLVNEHLYDYKWQEVFLLVAGMLDDADELLKLMRQKNDEILKLPLVNDLMIRAEKSLLPTQKPLPEVIRRNFSIFIALAFARTRVRVLINIRGLARASVLAGTRARARACVRALDYALDIVRDIARPLSRALDRALSFDRTLDRTLSLDRTLDLTHAHALDIANTLDIDLNLIEGYIQTKNLDEQNIWEIYHYFRANLLMVTCLQSDCFVSKDVRERILNEMLTPRKEG